VAPEADSTLLKKKDQEIAILALAELNLILILNEQHDFKLSSFSSQK